MPPAARGRHGGGHPIAHLDGLDIAYEEHGAGDPLVLVSGIGMQLVGWPLGFIDLLVARGFRVIVLDNRDVGLSSKLTAHGVPPLQRLGGTLEPLAHQRRGHQPVHRGPADLEALRPSTIDQELQAAGTLT